MNQRPNVIALAPNCDLTDVGEAWCAAKWVQELSKCADVTLLTQERSGRKPLEQQFPNVHVISKLEPSWAMRLTRLNAMAKLSYPSFYRWAKVQISRLIEAGHEFDVAHQFTPLALRFPSPFSAFDIPYILGPLGGSLPTPEGFKVECNNSAHWYTKLRILDAYRLKYDRHLKTSYEKASVIMGVAPYVGDHMEHLNIKRFIVESELGADDLPDLSHFKNYPSKQFRLLHVGRGVRTKGLRDTIKAMSLLPTLDLHLDVAGQGEEIEMCQAMACDMGLGEKITFHGQIPRSEVEMLYQKADVFCFPSFREPSGSVVYEALRRGLPVITADRGGPSHVVDASCGLKIPVTNPTRFARDIAAAINKLHQQPSARQSLSRGAHDRIRDIALWPHKIKRLLALYQSIIQQNQTTKELAS